ncbi:MAG TPA: succinate dehydrogenase [Ruminococcus sp.]|jgi:succinate dehydrogenase / fumarate reductase iron-sulfur subunit|nr:succinate dehydrogenase [Ruminococcus sp.]
MQITLKILRRESPDTSPYWQSIPFQTEDENATVATALTNINSGNGLTDTEGNAVRLPIQWECSCLQKKCGACAMVVNGCPVLACNAQLKQFGKSGTITVEPLRKFPVVSDLVTDRSIIFENLKTLRLWFAQQAQTDGDIAYESSRCLQCGCCLEVCPNFYAGGEFFGMAGFVPISRILTALPESQKQELCQAYRKRLYEGCGKSLACRNVCPAGIDIDKLLINSNAVAVWKRFFRKR